MRLNLSYGGMDRVPLLPQFRNERGYWGVDYPIQMVPTPDSPFVLISSKRQGLYAGFHDTTAKELVQFTFELKPGYKNSLISSAPCTHNISGHLVHLEFSAIHFPFLASGKRIKLPPVVLKPYIGTWHRGVGYYKEWRNTWFKPPGAPNGSKI